MERQSKECSQQLELELAPLSLQKKLSKNDYVQGLPNTRPGTAQGVYPSEDPILLITADHGNSLTP